VDGRIGDLLEGQLVLSAVEKTALLQVRFQPQMTIRVEIGCGLEWDGLDRIGRFLRPGGSLTHTQKRKRIGVGYAPFSGESIGVGRGQGFDQVGDLNLTQVTA